MFSDVIQVLIKLVLSAISINYNYNMPLHFFKFTYLNFQSNGGLTPSRVSPHTFFYLSNLVSPLFFVNLPTNFFPSGVTPLKGVTRGGPPPSDATGQICQFFTLYQFIWGQYLRNQIRLTEGSTKHRSLKY